MKECFSIVAGIFLVCLGGIAVEPEPYEAIKIKEVFSKRVIRDKYERVYSGQIKSEAGLKEFQKTYEIDVGVQDVNFKKKMLIFGITDEISTRAFQFLKQEKIKSFTLDYADTGIRYKIAIPEEGKKYSHLQVFLLDRIENIAHVGVKNLVRDGLSKVYDDADHRNSG